MKCARTESVARARARAPVRVLSLEVEALLLLHSLRRCLLRQQRGACLHGGAVGVAVASVRPGSVRTGADVQVQEPEHGGTAPGAWANTR